MADSNIRALLDHALGNKALGESPAVRVVPFSDPDFGHFAIRIHKNVDLASLADDTALTPVPELTHGVHVGQPLMQTRDGAIEIVLRQPGRSLDDWLEEKKRTLPAPYTNDQDNEIYKAARADMALFEALLTYHDPFGELFEQARHLGALGISPDLNLKNILLDKGTLRLTDQMHYRLPTAGSVQAQQNITGMAHCLPYLLDEDVFFYDRLAELDPALSERYCWLHKHIVTAVNEAKKHSCKKHDPRSVGPLAFARTDSVKGVSLSEPPHALLTQLQALEKLAAIPQRA